jgi:UDP-N-acetylmuramoyl-tripeptide--D-alanyl-D-alanine ligase
MNNTNPWFVLGDMFELGEAAHDEHKQIVDLLLQLKAKHVILTGKNFTSCLDETQFRGFETTDDALIFLQNNPINNAQVLVKGSRGMQLEKLIPAL